ncbi:hypothetical protein FRC04_004074 [Tulasnella sp. 424]|nr:hypothetical protein FRC04_004074 [Tulasnella sp. 424]KAG8964505.1 hypothetical protein FRC05_003786 [Tulasnella sp. 425]
MSQDIARIYPAASEIKGYSRLNQWDQEKLDELITKFRRPPTGESDGVNTWVKETSNAVQPPLDSDKASTDFGEPANDRRSSWPPQPQTSSNANSRQHVIPALGLELHSTTTSTVKPLASAAPNGVEASTRRETTSTTPSDLPVFKANVGIAAAKIEVAKAQVKQELAKRKLLERQIALRAIRRRLRNESTRVAEVAKEEAKEAEQSIEEGESDSRYADAQVQTEEEVREVREKTEVPDELDEEDDELLLADSDISMAKAEIRVAQAEVLWEEAKLRLLQREVGR